MSDDDERAIYRFTVRIVGDHNDSGYLRDRIESALWDCEGVEVSGGVLTREETQRG